MALLKHKLFLVPIKDGSINLGDKVLSEINQFLSEENYIYMSHSITTISKDELINTTGNDGFKIENYSHNSIYKFSLSTYSMCHSWFDHSISS